MEFFCVVITSVGLWCGPNQGRVDDLLTFAVYEDNKAEEVSVRADTTRIIFIYFLKEVVW